jgi:hypothetical protein
MSIMPLSRANAASEDKGMKTQRRDPRSASRIQIVDNPRHREQLIVRRVRLWDRILTRVLASSLDGQLAAGNAPESTHLLATRAEQLASVRTRRELARDFEQMLELISREATARSPRIRVCRESITDVAPDLREMLTKLETPLPTSARGVAMARVLLTDGTGPLFNRHSSTNLRGAIHDATVQLDSAGSAVVA